MFAQAEAKVVSEDGIHARPALMLVELANTFASTIWLEKDGIEVNAKSVLGVLMLSAKAKSTIKIKAEGEDAAFAVEALKRLIESGFQEKAANIR